MNGYRFWFLCVSFIQFAFVPALLAQDLGVNWYPEFSPDRPGEVQVEGPIPLGDGRYRMVFSATPPSTYEMAVQY